MKTVLVFVLGSSDDPYPKLMQTSRETWDSIEVAGVPVWYYSNTLKDHPTRTVQFPVSGGLYDMGRKNLLAYRWALDSIPEWDYMARVNVSCYVRKTVLFDHVQSLPKTGVMRGVKAPMEGGYYLWGGAQFIMSRDVVKAIVDNQAKWNHNEMEDVAVSRLTAQLGIPHDGEGIACSINKSQRGWLCIAYNSESFEFGSLSEFPVKGPNQFFIRVKQDLQRENDMMIMRELWKAEPC